MQQPIRRSHLIRRLMEICPCLGGGFFMLSPCHLSKLSPSPEASAMIGLVRLHTYKAGEFHLVDVPLREARKLKKRLQAKGFVIAHTETV